MSLEVAAQHHAAEAVTDEVNPLGVDPGDEVPELRQGVIHGAAHGGIAEAMPLETMLTQQPPAQQHELRTVEPQTMHIDCCCLHHSMIGVASTPISDVGVSPEE